MHVGWKWFGNFQTLHYLTMHSVEEQSESPGLLFVYWRTHRSFPTYRMLPGCCWSKSNGDSLDAFSRSTTHTQNHEHFFLFFFDCVEMTGHRMSRAAISISFCFEDVASLFLSVRSNSPTNRAQSVRTGNWLNRRIKNRSLPSKVLFLF